LPIEINTMLEDVDSPLGVRKKLDAFSGHIGAFGRKPLTLRIS
jgi:hypothetical protein